jgi:hypothetical protein
MQPLFKRENKALHLKKRPFSTGRSFPRLRPSTSPKLIPKDNKATRKSVDETANENFEVALEELKHLQLTFSKEEKGDRQRIQLAEKQTPVKVVSTGETSEEQAKLIEKNQMAEKIMKRLHQKNKELEAQIVKLVMSCSKICLSFRKGNKNFQSTIQIQDLHKCQNW